MLELQAIVQHIQLPDSFATKVFTYELIIKETVSSILLTLKEDKDGFDYAYWCGRQ